MKYYAWQMESPMDVMWEAMPTIVQAIQIATDHDEGRAIANLIGSVWFAAQPHLRKCGWEGDIRGGVQPRVFWIPNEYAPKPGIVFKQENNGGTFIVSPVDFSRNPIFGLVEEFDVD